jgi:hypothetical protein
VTAPLILAIDPGTEESGFVMLDDGHAVGACVVPNSILVENIANFVTPGVLAIEMIASYGMPVGREVFETCVWVGRFAQAWEAHQRRLGRESPALMVYRKDVKMRLCGTPRAKDANIRQALIDLIGPQGTKRAPGPTYGVKSHAWAALGVAMTVAAELTSGD